MNKIIFLICHLIDIIDIDVFTIILYSFDRISIFPINGYLE